VAIGEDPRRRLVGRSFARDYVSRDRPRRTAEAEQRYLRGKRRAHARHGLINRGKNGLIRLGRERRDGLGIFDRIEFRPLAGDERHLAAERVRNDQDVGK
jgi:hypothetical protein